MGCDGTRFAGWDIGEGPVKDNSGDTGVLDTLDAAADRFTAGDSSRLGAAKYAFDSEIGPQPDAWWKRNASDLPPGLIAGILHGGRYGAIFRFIAFDRLQGEVPVEGGEKKIDLGAEMHSGSSHGFIWILVKEKSRMLFFDPSANFKMVAAIDLPNNERPVTATFVRGEAKTFIGLEKKPYLRVIHHDVDSIQSERFTKVSITCSNSANYPAPADMLVDEGNILVALSCLPAEPSSKKPGDPAELVVVDMVSEKLVGRVVLPSLRAHPGLDKSEDDSLGVGVSRVFVPKRFPSDRKPAKDGAIYELNRLSNGNGYEIGDELVAESDLNSYILDFILRGKQNGIIGTSDRPTYGGNREIYAFEVSASGEKPGLTSLLPGEPIKNYMCALHRNAIIGLGVTGLRNPEQGFSLYSLKGHEPLYPLGFSLPAYRFPHLTEQDCTIVE